MDPEKHSGPERRREAADGVRFDPTINLGHILTFIGFVVAIFAAWTSLDKRVTVLEEGRVMQAQVDRHQDQVLGQQMTAIQRSLDALKSEIQRVNDRLDRNGAHRP